MVDELLIGTSGWGYDEWIGPFYPKGLKPRDFLPYYSKIFRTNEINTTFYQIPSKRMVTNWARNTPEDFKFSAKLPKTVTHDAKLNVDECLDDLSLYLGNMDPLVRAGKLWTFLIQLPPSFRKEEHFEQLKRFIDEWPAERSTAPYHLTVEFRDKSWMEEEIFTYLKSESLTYCGVIEPKLPPRMDVTNPEFAYIRFHGYGTKIWFDYQFSDEEIEKWSEKVKEVLPEAKKVGIYFNNHFSGYAPKNALMMMEDLEVKPRNDPKHINILDVKKKAGTQPKGQKGLDDFMG